MAWTPCGADSPASASAAEDDEIGMLAHEQGDGARDVFVGDEPAAMDVGDQADAQPAERRGQTGDRHVLSRDRELVPPVQIPVRTRSRHRADASGEQRLEDRASSDAHRLV